MSALTPDATTYGKPLFDDTSTFRARDDQSDSKSGGTYSHNVLEWSATEANEWVSFFQYLVSIVKGGGGALTVRNVSGGTLAVGPVRATGYNVANGAFTIVAADATGAAPGEMLLLASLANNTNGTAYLAGDFTSALNTLAATVGDPVYLAAGGGITLTAPTAADSIKQVIGHVKTLDGAAGIIRGLIHAPVKFGTSWLQALAITDAQVAAANKDGAAGTACMRTLSTTATTACAGNDARLSDTRTPTDNTVTAAKLATDAVDNRICDGRLTLTTAVPVTTSDVTGATSVYFTPYQGNRIALYDGTSRWKLLNYTEKTQALGTLTNGKNYDVFAYDNSGTVALELSAAWTNDTTRADALTLQDGVYVKSGATTRRYLGTFRTTSTTTTEDSEAKRFLINAYNRVPRMLYRHDDTNSWTSDASAFENWNGSTSNQVEFLCTGVNATGNMDQPVTADFNAYCSHSANSCAVSIGLDGTASSARYMTGVGSVAATASAKYLDYPGLGYHYLRMLQYANGATATFRGDAGAAFIKSALIGTVWG